MRLLEGHRGAVRAVAYAPGGERLATGGEDGTVRLWDLHAGGPPEVLPELPAGVEALAWSPDGSTLAAGLANGSVYLQGPRGWRQLPAEHIGGVRLVAFSLDGASLITGGWDSRLRRTLLHGASPVVTDIGHGRPPMAYNPATSVAASACEDGGVTLDEVAEPQKGPGASYSDSTGIISSPASPVTALTLATASTRLAIGHADGRIAVNDTDDGSFLRALFGHTWVVFGLTFSPDGRSLVSGSADGTVRLWDVDRGAERACYRFHRRWVTAVAFAPDGLTVAAAGADGIVAVCDVG